MRKLGSDGKEQRSGGVGATSIGTLAARPAASLVGPGAVYWATDTGAVYRSDGTSWVGPLNPGAQLDYQQITANSVGISATTEATAVTIITGNSVTYDGTQVKIEVYCPSVLGVNATSTYLGVFRDTTAIGQAKWAGSTSSVGWQGGLHCLFDTPAAGAHTYSVKCFVSGGPNTINAGPGGSGNLVPAYLRVTKA